MAAQQLENLQEKMNWHWRNSMRVVRFLAFDARAALTLPVLLVYARTSTIIMTILVMLFFRYLERKGLTFPASLRTLRAWIIGENRPGWASVYRKRFRDFG